ncbi:CapA family protein [Pseudoruegeria sp. HB172150]|uniref:CapA family protein n=1 Tax=Pseudoruegeria sp. HB172150 TaxID=2721164 RepID=UPI001557FC77|nr:CapA family protein [Pseudoruegeria sp. HB172150]
MIRAALVLLLLAAMPARAQEIVITFGGDTNFAGNRETPSPDGIRRWRFFSIDEATENLRPEWTGDINFVNVETVVSARDGHPQYGKQFVFRSHPEQFRALIRAGVNAFGLANNHAYDHGLPGLADTLAFFRAEDQPDRPLLFAGIGTTSDAYRPHIVTVKGVRIALSSVSFGGGAFAPSDSYPGMAHLGQYDRVLQGLKAAEADIRILSIHYGTENAIELEWSQAAFFRRAVEEAGVNLVIGHHPHVVRAVEARPADNAAIFYSLGNFLFIGGAGKDAAPLGHDYGLMGKAYFRFDGRTAHLSAVEAVPLKGVHMIPHHPPPARASATIAHLNALSARSVGDRAARFDLTDITAPRGLACYGGPYGPRTRAMCCSVERSLHCDLPDLM